MSYTTSHALLVNSVIYGISSFRVTVEYNSLKKKVNFLVTYDLGSCDVLVSNGGIPAMKFLSRIGNLR